MLNFWIGATDVGDYLVSEVEGPLQEEAFDEETREDPTEIVAHRVEAGAPAGIWLRVGVDTQDAEGESAKLLEDFVRENQVLRGKDDVPDEVAFNS